MKLEQKIPTKYCTFHKDTGNWTRDCRHLKWEIEKMLSDGNLQEIVYGNRDPRMEIKDNNPRREVAPHQG